ncbi:MAG TPA: hypothetical protein VKA48_00305 [Gammaproteobacteria bacterium]|nr:hypothetical protein [Gammaproteobacteria bacterium]
MKTFISVGDKMETVSGHSVRILATDRKGDGPIVGLVDMEDGVEQVQAWREDGMVSARGTSNLDLNIFLEDVMDGEVPWPIISERFNYAAMDSDGSWYLYQVRPSLGVTAWNVGCDSPMVKAGMLRMPKAPLSAWKHTLMARPK